MVHVDAVCPMHRRCTPGHLRGPYLRAWLINDKEQIAARAKDIVDWLEAHPEACSAGAR